MSPGVVRERRADLALLAGWILAISVARAGRVTDTDPYWQIRAGQEMLAGSPLARPDSWSWAPTAGLFYPNSPAWNVLLAEAWNAAGAWGLFVVSLCSVAVCLSLIAYLAMRLGARALPLVPVILVVSGAALPVLSPRPALASQSILLAAIAAAEWWSRRAGRQSVAVNLALGVAVSAAIAMAGNWVHLSWASLAAVTAAAWAVIWLLADGIPRRIRVVLIGSGTLGFAAGALLGPYGLDVWARQAAVFAACRGIVVEWSGAFTPELGIRWWPLALAVTSATVVATAWCVRSLRSHGRSDPRLALSTALTACSLPFAVAGFVAIRFVPTAILTFAPVAAAAFCVLALWIARRYRDGASSPRWLSRKAAEWTSAAFWRVVMTGTLIALVPLVALAAWPHAEPATTGINRLLPTGCRLFGTSIEAASVILTRRDVTVWLDGRAEYWGRQRLERASDYLYHPADAELVPPGTTCVLLADPALDPDLTALTRELDASPGWRHVASQDGANLWLPAEASTAPLS